MKRAAVLLVGLDAALERSLRAAFESAGGDPSRVDGARSALESIRTTPVSALVAPSEMLAGPGLDLAARALRLRPSLVIVAVGDAGPEEREAAFRSGVFDIVPASSREPLEPTAVRALRQAALLAELQRLREAARARAGLGGLVGRSDSLRRAREELVTLAATEAPVLLVGEAGTGKEHGARFLHAASRRASGPFVVVDRRGGAGPESDPFARRGALAAESAWDRAGGGTLFLRDVCDLAPEVQDRITAALGAGPSSLGPRVVAASEVDPDLAARSGRMPPALRAAFEGAIVPLPPLRERRDDIPFLARHFLEAIREMNELRELRMTPDAAEVLAAHDWPGNVRELRTAVEHAALVADDGVIRPRDLPEAIRMRKASALPDGRVAETAFREAKREVVDRFERDFLERLLDRYAGNVTEAAIAAGMMRSALQRLLRKHRIHSAAFRSGRGTPPESER
jgi:DNA-binding NtrC family response regulator